MLPAETFQMRKRHLNFFVAKPREKAEVILKTCKLFLYGNIYCITKLLCEKGGKKAALERWL